MTKRIQDPNQQIALFIDADNAPASSISLVLSDMARYGVVSIRRAYGNWKSPHLQSWEAVLHEHAIQPIQQFDLIKGKNASDMALVIDVMDVLYLKNVRTIGLMSSDCDFTPLATRVLSDGVQVIGYGEKKTPQPFVRSCSRFLLLDKEITNQSGKDEKCSLKTQDKLKCDTKLINLLREAVSAHEEEDGWAHLGRIGSHISNHDSFDPRNYGFKKLSELFMAIDLFETRVASGNHLWVKDRRNHPRKV